MEVTAGSMLWTYANSTLANTLVLGAGVYIALRQFRSGRSALNKQLDHMQKQMRSSQEQSEAQVKESRIVAKRAETARLLLSSRGDRTLQRGQATLKLYYTSDDRNVRQLAGNPGEGDDPEVKKLRGDRAAVMYLLNHYETVCICIKHGIYCESMILDAWQTMMIQNFDRSRSLIEAVRQSTNVPTALIEFEMCVEKWRRGERIYQDPPIEPLL